MTWVTAHWVVTALLWLVLILLWAVIIQGIREARRVARARKNDELWERTKGELVEQTGLTPLQVQIALDEGNAAFTRRLSELQQRRVDG